ncbi:recombination-associated protein RdgC [Glaciecola sp. XM2]|uniref:recombination-associated protein RdgC n=1 Tax=Glaciecola sp. XM2 TaxID=1914931 RepID=UPI001BDF5033|nr:recombination-associated protein RdgC [Glaciecola sp. XM2]MBT1450382.1 recombination-associated protein RdgC [Glaciecola sp. XM2]
MWFKNLKIYRFTQDFTFDNAQLDNMLESMPFRHCSAQEISSMGFVSPVPKGEALYLQSSNAYWFTLKREDKILPASVVNAELAEKVSQIENETGSPVGKKAQKDLKEEVVQRLLPRAFNKHGFINGYVSLDEQIVVVDASSDGAAEVFLACLRKCLGSLPVVPLAKSQQQEVLTSWLLKDAPQGIELLDEAEFKSPAQDGGIIRCKQHNLDADEILAHIQAGMWVQKLAIAYQDKLTCIIAEDLSIKRLKFTDIVKQQNEDIGKDELQARLDADFSLFSAEIDAFVRDLKTMFDLQEA